MAEVLGRVWIPLVEVGICVGQCVGNTLSPERVRWRTSRPPIPHLPENAEVQRDVAEKWMIF